MGKKFIRLSFFHNSPWSIKTTRSATALAKDISCVTITIVLPALASSNIVSSTSRTISGSSAAVTLIEQHNLRVHHQCTHDRNTLLPDRRKAVSENCHTCREALLFPEAVLPRKRRPLCSLLHLKRRQDHIFQDRLVWKKLVALKYHPDLLADPAIFFAFPSMVSPRSVMLPSCIGSKALIHRSSVLLPHPDGPMITTTSPLWMVRLRSFKISFPS